MSNSSRKRMEPRLSHTEAGLDREASDVDSQSRGNGSVLDEVLPCEGHEETRSTGSVIMEYVNACIVAVVLAAFIMTFVARSFVVQGSSMEPTLYNGERLLVNRFIYRFREPQRGDIIVFRYPQDPRQMFIKRVIGVPGDELMISGGMVYVNGTGLNEPYIAESSTREYGPALVPTKRVFVLGDNRNNSQDSTDDSVGMVPFGSIQGKAFVVYWPVDRIRTLKNPTCLEAIGTPKSGMAAAPGMP